MLSTKKGLEVIGRVPTISLSNHATPHSIKVPEPIDVLALVKGDSEHLIGAA
jgi:hypothetical protein